MNYYFVSFMSFGRHGNATIPSNKKEITPELIYELQDLIKKDLDTQEVIIMNIIKIHEPIKKTNKKIKVKKSIYS